MAKIAILWPGRIRLFEETIWNYRRTILSLQDAGHIVDLYVSTYATESGIDDFCQLYNPRLIDVENTPTIHVPPVMGELNILRVTSILYLHYKLYRLWNIFRSIEEKYDIIVRYRDRLLLERPIPTTLGAGLHIPSGGNHWGGINDVFAIGDYNSMQVYCSCYPQINHFIMGGVIHKHECINAANLSGSNITINRFPFATYLIKDEYCWLWHYNEN